MIKLYRDGRVEIIKFDEIIFDNDNKIIEYLDEKVCLEEGFTLKNLFQIIDNHEKDLINKVFSSHMGNYPLQLFIDEALTEFKPHENEQPEYLKIWRMGHYYEGNNELKDFEDYSSLSIKMKGKEENYSTMFAKLSTYNEIPIIIDNSFKIYKTSQDNSYEKICDLEKEYTLYEFIGAILKEISFCGSPEERDEEGKKMLEELFNKAEFYPIHVKVIDNQYSSEPFYYVYPWVQVATPKGLIKLGWRKRVIQLDWSKSDIRTTSEELFPQENTTKCDKMIHCWGKEKAIEYLTILKDAE